MAGGTLYIVSTPIGNLEDITLRALRILKDADYIAAEDTRHSLKLLNHYGIAKPLISYWSGREKARSEAIVSKLRDGFSVAVISDAGTPGISDPGAVVIKQAIEEGMAVVPIPGPSALVAALCVSGLPAEEFTFIGFLPPKTAQRRKKLDELKHEQRTLIFYEAPHRLLEALGDMEEILGPREAAVVKEITKLHEGTVRGSLAVMRDELQRTTIAGEYVIVVGGSGGAVAISVEEALNEIRLLMQKGMGRKEAVRTIADEYGLSKNELYDRSLETQ